MTELSKTYIGTFEAEDSLIAADPTTVEGVVFGTKAGSWKVFKCEDAEHTHELLIVHSEVKNFREDRVSWIAESCEVETKGQAGFYNLEAFRNKVDLGDVSGHNLNHFVGDSGCLVPSGYGEGLYNVLLAYNRSGEAIAAKLVFIDEVVEDEFEPYVDDDRFDLEGLWDREDFDLGEDYDEDEEDY